jgi:predicted tellurium resistance membrane protein TerC
MMIAAGPIAEFVHDHPSTKMLALAFLVMVGMALMADGLHFHVERAFIYSAMLFSGAVEGLNLWRAKRLAANGSGELAAAEAELRRAEARVRELTRQRAGADAAGAPRGA